VVRTRFLVLAATLAVLTLASPAAAASGATTVMGRQAVVSGGPCPDGSFTMSGDLVGCWTTDSIEFKAFGPNGVVVAHGTETFTGCIGSRCGTLSLTFVFVGRFDATGAELWGGCHHPIRAGSGDFAGATGEINFVDDTDGSELPPADYRGRIVFHW